MPAGRRLLGRILPVFSECYGSQGELDWCGREDSNFHGLPHSDLNAARLPVPPRPHQSPRRQAVSPCQKPTGGIANRDPAIKRGKARKGARLSMDWRISDGSGALRRGPERHGGPGGGHPRRRRAGAGLAAGAPAALYRRHQRQGRRPAAARPLPGLCRPAAAGNTPITGPGQRVAYVMLDLKERGPDVRRFVRDLEDWIIRTLARFNVTGERREGRVGIWVAHDGREDKIAAIGVRVRRWVTYHGIAINVDPDLSHFGGIVPCGIQEQSARRHLAGAARLHRLDARVRHGPARRVRGSVRERPRQRGAVVSR